MTREAIDRFFEGYPESVEIFAALRRAMETLGPAAIRASRSQVSFADGRVFARAWIPGRYLGPGHAPLVLTLTFSERHQSPRWKQIVEPVPGHFTHHLELHSTDDVDEEVLGWLREARRNARRAR